jgi:hypothetical protein
MQTCAISALFVAALVTFSPGIFIRLIHRRQQSFANFVGELAERLAIGATVDMVMGTVGMSAQRW